MSAAVSGTFEKFSGKDGKFLCQKRMDPPMDLQRKRIFKVDYNIPTMFENLQHKVNSSTEPSNMDH
ncbi:MAG: hypothetical protein MJ252_08355 [archaeon]|nr:hypothetical protein [archaeon]